MGVISLVWDRLAGLFGNIFLVAAAAWLIVWLTERAVLRRKRRETLLQHDWVVMDPSASEKKPVKRRICFITGASGGLGSAYARLVAKHPERYGINEIWITGRRIEALEKAASRMKIRTVCIPMDLNDEEDLLGFQRLLKKAFTSERGLVVNLLINCAGAGKIGASVPTGYENEWKETELNCGAQIRMTDLLVPFMPAGARIMNVCSMAAFQPVPYLNAYASAKAYMYSYTRSLRVELMDQGISVTAVCPYWISDTGFIQNAAGEKKQPFLSSKAGTVAFLSLRDTLQDRALSTPGIMATLHRIFGPLFPDGILAWLGAMQIRHGQKEKKGQ